MLILTIIALVTGAMAVLRYCAGLSLLLRYLRGARLRALETGPTPPISLLKPLFGRDPGLATNLRATLRQNYPKFEVIFLHEREDDPALEALAEAARGVPDVEVKTVSGRAADVPNPKVAVLVGGEAAARHGIVASADSDVRPDPLYLRDIAFGLQDADAVSFAPVLFGARTIWARAAALLVNGDALLAALMTSGQAITGSTVAVRREALESIGGYRRVGDRIADDYSLGAALKEAGFRLVLARRPARLYMPGGNFRETARWVVRWTRTIRSTVPGMYAIAVPLAFAPALLLATALLTGYATPALLLLALHTVARAVTAIAVDVRLVRDQSTLKALPLLPLLWILEPLAILGGVAGNTVSWRGRRYRLKGGRATLVEA